MVREGVQDVLYLCLLAITLSPQPGYWCRSRSVLDSKADNPCHPTSGQAWMAWLHVTSRDPMGLFARLIPTPPAGSLTFGFRPAGP